MHILTCPIARLILYQTLAILMSSEYIVPGIRYFIIIVHSGQRITPSATFSSRCAHNFRAESCFTLKISICSNSIIYNRLREINYRLSQHIRNLIIIFSFRNNIYNSFRFVLIEFRPDCFDSDACLFIQLLLYLSRSL